MLGFSLRSSVLAQCRQSVRPFHVSAIAANYPLGKSGKPLSSFMKFAKEKRAEAMKAVESKVSGILHSKDVGRELGQMWRSLSESERKRYKDEYTKAVEKFK